MASLLLSAEGHFLGRTALLPSTTSFAWEVWFKLTSIPVGYGTIMALINSDDTAWVALQHHDELGVVLWDYQNGYDQFAGILSIGQWYLAGMRCSGTGATDLRAYIYDADQNLVGSDYGARPGGVVTPAYMRVGYGLTGQQLYAKVGYSKVWNAPKASTIFEDEMYSPTFIDTTDANCGFASSGDDIGPFGDRNWSVSAGIISDSDGPPVTGSLIATPNSGALVVSGLAPSLKHSYFRTPAAATLQLVTGFIGPTVTQNAPNTITPNTGALALSTIAPSILRGKVMLPQTGSLTLSPKAPFLNGLQASPARGILTFTGYPPTLTTQGITVHPQTGALSFTGFMPEQTYQVDPPFSGLLTLTGDAPTVTVSSGGALIIPPGALALAGQTGPSLKMNFPRVTQLGSMDLTGYAPTVARGDNRVATPGRAILSYTTFPPIVISGNNTYVTTQVGSMAITEYAPTLTMSDLQLPSSASGSLGLTGAAPILSQTASHVIATQTGSLNLTSKRAFINGVGGGSEMIRKFGFGVRV